MAIKILFTGTSTESGKYAQVNVNQDISFVSINKYDFLVEICGNCNCLNCECNDSVTHNSVEPVSTTFHNAGSLYDLLTYFDQNLETNALYLDNTTYISMHDQPIINNVHDTVLNDDTANTSMCAQNSLDLELSKKILK